MIDTYTKAILTLIGISLAAIAAAQWTSSARAIGDRCGNKLIPCYVRVENTPLDVSMPRGVEVWGTVETMPFTPRLDQLAPALKKPAGKN